MRNIRQGPSRQASRDGAAQLGRTSLKQLLSHLIASGQLISRKAHEEFSEMLGLQQEHIMPLFITEGRFTQDAVSENSWPSKAAATCMKSAAKAM